MIKVNLTKVMFDRQISSKELAQRIGITPANLSILKTGKAHGVRFNTLEKLCAVLQCQPGDILEYVPDKQNPINKLN
ncbi:helix-turn-helix domain-containing protein [Bombilactobacillus bombi]|uniref:helix-turn-helix domain-containing protein n=1 Tax=Bombilactobacillus bombi TaxID=1303590 RepID=UPI0015E5FF2B|nr:helix-turn-helix transcriptional regulator [Bombilactobacillus bombi]MBA1434388.1 transcriptional regulator [Bombilactobacillus bombi]